MIGKRGVGKTTLINDILQRYDDEFISNSLIISPKDKIVPFYKEFFPSAEVIYQNDYDKIKTYMDNKKPGAIVFDDCLSSKGDWMKDGIYRHLMLNGRFYKKMVITAIQFPLGIPPDLRSNFDYIFMFSEDFFSNKKRLYDQYAGMFPSFSIFDNVFKFLTGESYSSMVIKKIGYIKKFEDKVFWHKA